MATVETAAGGEGGPIRIPPAPSPSLLVLLLLVVVVAGDEARGLLLGLGGAAHAALGGTDGGQAAGKRRGSVS